MLVMKKAHSGIPIPPDRQKIGLMRSQQHRHDAEFLPNPGDRMVIRYEIKPTLPGKVSFWHAPRLSPFVSPILQELMEKIKMPTCKYDRKIDLEDHISTCEGYMLLYTNTNSL